MDYITTQSFAKVTFWVLSIDTVTCYTKAVHSDIMKV